MASPPTTARAMPSWMQDGWDMAPLGESFGAALVCAIVYYMTGLGCIVWAVTSGYQPGFEMGLGCIARGIALTFRAKSIADGGTRLANGIVYGFLIGSGFSMAIALHLIAVAGWFKNTIPKANFKPRGMVWRNAMLALLVIVVLFGSGVGLAAVLEMYVNPTPEKLALANKLRKASVGGMFTVASIALIVIVTAVVVAARNAGLTSNGKLSPHASILFALPGMLLLEWSAAYRLAGATTHPYLNMNESYFYCLMELPELLQALLYLFGPTARIHLSSNYSQWWQDIGSARARKGGKPTPPRPLAAWFDDDEPKPPAATDADPGLEHDLEKAATASKVVELSRPSSESGAGPERHLSSASGGSGSAEADEEAPGGLCVQVLVPAQGKEPQSKQAWGEASGEETPRSLAQGAGATLSFSVSAHSPR